MPGLRSIVVLLSCCAIAGCGTSTQFIKHPVSPPYIRHDAVDRVSRLNLEPVSGFAPVLVGANSVKPREDLENLAPKARANLIGATHAIFYLGKPSFVVNGQPPARVIKAARVALESVGWEVSEIGARYVHMIAVKDSGVVRRLFIWEWRQMRQVRVVAIYNPDTQQDTEVYVGETLLEKKPLARGWIPIEEGGTAALELLKLRDTMSSTSKDGG